MSGVVLATPLGYWHDTDRQIAISTYRDRQAARAVNSKNHTRDLERFGTLPRIEARAS